uniref:Calpain catalytic domain-containing protein n=1 Tax=Meloidogyne hapla TaxID=6305 RepID=A0A1I8BII2_MELHA
MENLGTPAEFSFTKLRLAVHNEEITQPKRSLFKGRDYRRLLVKVESREESLTCLRKKNAVKAEVVATNFAWERAFQMATGLKVKIEVKPDEFNGLIGNLIKDHAGNIAGNLIKDQAGEIIGGLFGGGNKGGQGGKGRDKRDGKSGGISDIIGGLIGGGGDRGKYAGGGANVNNKFLTGGVCDLIGNLIGEAAHRFLGVNPHTGKIIGAIAGNVLFNLGGKDNKLGTIGKIILDNIISGKFHRDVKYNFGFTFYIFKVDPFVKPEPVPTPGPPIRRKEPVSFYDERDRCLEEKRLYEDPDFPANTQSLFFSRSPPERVQWLRPGEIVKEPQLICEGHSRFDVIQGKLGDCWLMAAAANLTLRDELFYRVVPPDQSFTENYAGIFHFQFWQYGRWVDVVIDDRLPCSLDGELLYMHSRDLYVKNSLK